MPTGRRLTRAEAQDQLAAGKVYGALVVPPGFTDSVRALAEGTAEKRPTLTVLTNPGMGSLGSALADQISERAAAEASQELGRRLTESAGGDATPAQRLLLRDRPRRAADLGAGEILLNAMDADGTQDGFDLELIRLVRQEVSIPVIASGGAGAVEHFPPAVEAGADAVLAATVFHFGTLRIADVKQALASAGHPVR